ncbi:helix-turn-helix domain-containing protein [Streptomyces sp. NPDC058321]|uniref:helix-turn-helix domain-containing protein n=1 Tax=Streptomyces sp. NPDC058321 TaxID=3346445 RepID=UPI0036EA3275
MSKAQVARALGVSPSMVGGWESGRDPAGETRAKYAYLLNGLAAKLTPPAEPESPEPESLAPAVDPEDLHAAGDEDDVETLTTLEPCVLCGAPARQ